MQLAPQPSRLTAARRTASRTTAAALLPFLYAASSFAQSLEAANPSAGAVTAPSRPSESTPPPIGTRSQPSAPSQTPAAASPQPQEPTPSTASIPGITPPHLIQFQPAVYPREAEQQGLEADVVLALSIDAEGHVTLVEVKEPGGRGFDEAAADAAQKFVFEPAKRRGVAMASKILYRYEFRLAPKATPSSSPSAPSTSQAPSSSPQADRPRLGELRGRLVAGTPPSPLAGMSLTVVSPDKQTFRLTTGADGTWVLPDAPQGDYLVSIEATGYRRVRQLERVNAGQATAVTYGLESSDEMPLEVTVRGAAIRREVTHYELPREELLRVPGTMGDAIHAVEAMPGVARPPAFSGVLLVRGSAPADTQVYVDGTPIPRIFHYASMSSVVPGEMLERIEFYPSNFSVRYGRGMGGVVEVRLRETNPDNKFHGSAQIDFINARANIEGPLRTIPGWSYMGGIRTSYVDRWLVPMMRGEDAAIDGMPRYHDYQLYLQRRLPQNGVYRIGVIGAYDTFVPIATHPEDWADSKEWFVHCLSELRLPLSSIADLRASWSLGRNQSSFAYEGESNQTRYTLGTLRSELSLKTGSLGIARAGADVNYAPFRVETRTQPPAVGGEISSGYDDRSRLRSYDINGVYLRPGAYAEYELAPSHRVDITAGIRADYTRDTHETDWAPRVSARYVLVDQPSSTVLKGGLGLFYQPPDPSLTLPELGTEGLGSSHAIHSMLGVEQSFGKNVTVSLEGFEKEMRNLLAERVDGSGREIVANTGKGRVWGADLLLRYHSDQRFFGWVAYTLSRSTRKPSNDDSWQLYRYDQTHVLNVLASYRLGRGYEIGGRFRYMSGFVYRACFGGLFNNTTGEYDCYGPLAQNRLAPYHQLDLRAEKAWDKKTYKISVYLDLINAYFHNSPDAPKFNYDLSGVKPISRSLPLIPSFGVRGEI